MNTTNTHPDNERGRTEEEEQQNQMQQQQRQRQQCHRLVNLVTLTPIVSHTNIYITCLGDGGANGVID